jgi:hypothetical protein
LTKEIWKPIPGYEGLYEVSNEGRIKTLRNKRILKPNINSTGYEQVCFCVNGEAHTVQVHRIVAGVFCEKPAGKNIVDHINAIPTDNRAENLRWVTQKENVRFGRMVKRAVIRSDGKRYGCMNDVKDDGFEPKNVHKCCKGKRKTAGGYGWRYADEIVQATSA